MQRKLEIPEKVEITIEGNTVIVKKEVNELKEEFDLGSIQLEKKDDQVTITAEDPKKHEKAMLGTIQGKIQNMIKGLTEGYEYKLKLIYRHFPVKLDVKDKKVEIKNFAGEQQSRSVNIMGKNTEVEVKGEDITVKGKNKEKTGQTAANLEQATWIKKKDPRVFQDGIYIVKKPD